MARKRQRLGWRYDPEQEEFTLPCGQILTLRDIAQRIQDDVHCRHDFKGEWTGWKLRGQFLQGPGGIRLNPSTAHMFWRWVKSVPTERHDATTTTTRNTDRPRVTLIRKFNGRQNDLAANAPLIER